MLLSLATLWLVTAEPEPILVEDALPHAFDAARHEQRPEPRADGAPFWPAALTTADKRRLEPRPSSLSAAAPAAHAPPLAVVAGTPAAAAATLPSPTPLSAEPHPLFGSQRPAAYPRAPPF